jgi:cytosine/adenosine deaminase-related metal-dependent hydrolase
MTILIRGGLVLADADAQPVAADILVDGDRVGRVGPGLEAGPQTEVIDARHFLAIPGLVNAHTHAHNHLAKGAIDRMPLEVWIQYLAARVANRTPRDIYVGAAIGAIEQARTGTTCACEMAMATPFPTDEALDAVAQAYADVGVRASINAQVFDLPFWESLAGLEELFPDDLRRELASRPDYPRDEVLATVRRAVDRWHGARNGLLRFGIGPNLVTLCSQAFLEGCAELANSRQLTFQSHLCETKAEAYTAQQQYGKSATVKMHELGLLGPRTLLAHSIWLDDHDLDLVAQTGSSVAHNPGSNLKLGAGIAPVLQMRRRGINVAVGTDGSASSDHQNMFRAMQIAAILHRVVDPNDDVWPSAADALRMATLGGARAAGFEGQTGAIRPGMKADLVLLDLRSTYFHPRNDLVSQVVHCEAGSSVDTVLVDGRAIVRGGRVTGVDEDALLAEADEIGRRVAVEMQAPMSLVHRLEPYVRQAYLAANRVEWPVNRYASEAYRALPAR